MTIQGRPPAGDEATDARDSREIKPSGSATAAHVHMASRFVRRVCDLDVHSIHVAIDAWHQLMRTRSDAWFTAEEAVADAVVESGRTVQQATLLDAVSQCVLRGVWYRNARGNPPVTPEQRVAATEASGQYTATVAMLAVLVRDHLDREQFDLLYRPFETVIPVQELAA